MPLQVDDKITDINQRLIRSNVPHIHKIIFIDASTLNFKFALMFAAYKAIR